MTITELLTLTTVFLVIVGLMLDIVVRVIAYTRDRQKDFYLLTNRVALLEDEVKSIESARNRYLKEFRDVQGIIKKAHLYQRDEDEDLDLGQ